MIKVAVDTSALFGPSKFRGIGKYTSKLIEALRLESQVEVIETKDSKVPEDVDVVHYPYFDFFFLTLPLRKRHKAIVTIHDCTPLVFPKYYPPGIKGKVKFFLQKFSLKKVSAVLADSESSKNDIIRYLGVPSEKIQVVYLAPDPIYQRITKNAFLNLMAEKYCLPEEFVLYVGDVNYNKNLSGLVKAVKLIKNLKVDLVLVGKSFENNELSEVKNLKKLIDSLGLKERVKILGFVPDKDLMGIYNLAKVFCMVSLYEGFGLQILEAMASGCPVVTGNVSSLPEIAGGAAVLVDPYKIEEITVGIEKLIRDEKFRSKIVDAGLKRAGEFSWQKTAKETIKVYEKILAR